MEPVQQPDVHVDSIETANVSTSDHAVNDTLTVRFVVILLGVIVLASLGCLTAIVLSGVSVELAIVVGILSLATTSVGALGAMLASTASKRT